jgi:glycosyltransferase involved in cell wall biosynthesis
VLLALCKAQQQIPGVDVACAVMNERELSRELLGNGVRTFVFDEGKQGLGSLVSSLRRAAASFGADILHAHRTKENTMAAACRLLDRRTRRYLTTVHGMPEPATGGSALRRWLVNGTNQLVLRHGLHAVVAVSHDIGNQLRKDLGLRNVHVVHNGVERVAAPAESGRRVSDLTKPLHLVAMGRLVPIKRFDRLAGIAHDIARQTGHAPRVSLAGEGPLKDELAHTFQSVPGGEYVQMLGFVRDTAQLLRSADGLLITSDHEGIPMVALEALAAGIPVFAYAVGGLPEIAAESPAMRLAPPYATDALAGCITDWLRTGGTRSTELPARWPFDIQHCAESYVRLYQELLSR